MTGSNRAETSYAVAAPARRFAVVRIWLAIGNFAVVYLDHTVPEDGTIRGYAWAYGAAGLFLAYSLVFWALLGRGPARSANLSWFSPILDVCFGSLLIVVTNGYESPFNIWLVLAVIHSGFSRQRSLPIYVALFAVVMHCVIAVFPQDRPLDVAVFAVRTTYLFGVAALMASIGSSLAAYSNALALGAEVGRQLGNVTTNDEAIRVLLKAVTDQFNPIAARVSLNGDATFGGDAAPPAAGREECIPLSAGARALGQLVIRTRGRLNSREHKLLRILCNQTAATLKRIQLADCLAEEAVRIERLRILDNLHDGTVQTLAALDLRLMAIRMAASDPAKLIPELEVAGKLSRQALTQVRGLLDAANSASLPDPQVLRTIVDQRWNGPAHTDVDPHIELTPEQWRIAIMLVKEGLNNSRRHGDASRVDVRLFRDSTGATVCSLQNDGKAPPQPGRRGFGLTRLCDEAARIGGELRFAALRPTGAVLEVRFNGHDATEITQTGDRRLA